MNVDVVVVLLTKVCVNNEQITVLNNMASVTICSSIKNCDIVLFNTLVVSINYLIKPYNKHKLEFRTTCVLLCYDN